MHGCHARFTTAFAVGGRETNWTNALNYSFRNNNCPRRLMNLPVKRHQIRVLMVCIDFLVASNRELFVKRFHNIISFSACSDDVWYQKQLFNNDDNWRLRNGPWHVARPYNVNIGNDIISNYILCISPTAISVRFFSLFSFLSGRVGILLTRVHSIILLWPRYTFWWL